MGLAYMTLPQSLLVALECPHPDDTVLLPEALFTQLRLPLRAAESWVRPQGKNAPPPVASGQ